ncbi:SDR family oxidoreductase [Vibrio aestuarianus]|nr:SDR family oxidoreductase [Vibrio aestuarianus]
MKVAITGVNGLLGSTLFREAHSYGWEAMKLSRNDIKIETELETLSKILLDLDCSVLIHCAANTNVEACEDDRLGCLRDNVVLTEKLAIACRLNDIKFVFISSTGIYGKYQDMAYCEYDAVVPTTIHHQSKWLAEKLIQNTVKDYLIIRTGWLFGGDWNMPKNFVANRIKEAISSQWCIQSDTSQNGNPTFVDDVARNIYELLVQNYSGTFNCVNHGSATRFEYVTEIIRLSGLNVSVLPIDGSAFKRKAKVSHNETAVNFKLAEFGLDKMPSWKKKFVRLYKHY